MNPPRPKKSLGQHFLINPGISQRIAALLNLSIEDQVLEIGPGPGALTRYLAPHKRLLLIEKDAFWAREQTETTLLLDALQFDWSALTGRWKLTGNLPYNIASPLIWDILARCRACELAVFMVQKEVGERICARPSTRAYGALSVWVQCHARTKYEFTVKPGSFNPPPRVDSGVVSLYPFDEAPRHPEYLKRLLDLCFQARRKQLGGILRRHEFLLAALGERGLATNLRPENLTCDDYLALTEAWATHDRAPHKNPDEATLK